MKTRFIPQVLALAAMLLLNGCTQQSAGTAPAYVTTSSAPPAVVTQVVPVVATVATPVSVGAPVAETAPVVPSLIVSNEVAPVAPAELVLPANLRISKPLNEIIRLAQSGVEEPVILTYVTNSPAIFTLGAEEIVYLNDLGVSSSVITAMMQHDQLLRAEWANAANPPVVASNVEPVAAAPTYVNPPQAAPVLETQPVYVSNNYFYDSLSPYGSWVEIDGYGRCWRPTVAITTSSWQPYRDRGRWVHTDAGWYWMSDYSWGSVAFHYGRWFSHPRWGWCWWPDTVWAPSWVTWRYDNDHCGWAPLPPHSYYRSGVGFVYYDRSVGVSFDFGLHVGAFTFVPWGRFCDPRPYNYCLPRPRSVAIYNGTTIINNVAAGNNNTVFNRGIDKDRVRERSRTEVRTASIREERPRGLTPRSERFERDGRTLVVNRPALPVSPVAGSALAPVEKSTTRVTPNRATESRTVNSPTRPTGDRAVVNERNEIRPAREIETRSAVRPGTPNNLSPGAPAVVTTPKPAAPAAPVVSPAPIRTETRPDRSREGRSLDDSTPRARPSSTTVVRIPETKPTPTPARTATPIFSKPVVVETPVYTPTRPVAPTPQPRPMAPASAPSYRVAPSRPQSSAAINSASQFQNNQPVPSVPTYNRPNVEPRREERSSRNDVIDRARSQERISAPTYSAPTPRITPTPTPAPIQRPSYTPPAAPAVRSAPPAVQPRSEAPRPESRATPTPDSGRPGRSR
jgi:hypothetical protein